MKKISDNPKTSLMELIHPSEKQRVAFEKMKKYKFILYGGAMYGGKSYWLRWALVVLLVYYYRKYKKKNIVAGLFCEDYPALKDRHLSKIDGEFPAWLGTLHSDHKAYGRCMILNPAYGSGVIAFRNLDDASKYASAEFAAIAVDELTKNTYEKFLALRHRLRWPGIEDVKFIAGTNPGSIGHAWVKKMFIDKDFEPEEAEADQFCYVPAKYTDNPNKNSSYEATLNSLPEKLRKAFRDGDWDMFEGQYFTEWSREWNTCKPFKIPSHWMRFIWMDYGYSAPAAVHWAALDEIGRLFVYRELYVTGHTYKALARKIADMTPDWEKDVLEGNMVADPAIFAKKGEDAMEKSGAEQMEEETGGWLTFRRGNNDRVNGWGVMREYMKPFRYEGELTSKLIFFKGLCPNAIRTIPALVYYDPNGAQQNNAKIEDLNTRGEDHCGDAVRYGIMDVHELFSEKKIEAPKEQETTADIKKRDLLHLKKQKEQEENDIDWMTM